MNFTFLEGVLAESVFQGSDPRFKIRQIIPLRPDLVRYFYEENFLSRIEISMMKIVAF